MEIKPLEEAIKRYKEIIEKAKEEKKKKPKE